MILPVIMPGGELPVHITTFPAVTIDSEEECGSAIPRTESAHYTSAADWAAAGVP